MSKKTNDPATPDGADPASVSGPNLPRLLSIMARLRDPQTGCPWDVEQDFASIAPYTIEEAYEVAEAIELGDMEALKEELGDLLLQAVFHARMAEEEGLFAFDDVAGAIADKLVRRHPHVFGDGDHVDDRLAFSKEVWEASKAAERAAKAQDDAPVSVLDGVALALPALVRAEKLQKRAARIGFDWPEPARVLDKVEEELVELRAELKGGSTDRMEDELGDLLFALANLARQLEIDPEAALRRGNAKFTRRFHHIEAALAAADRAPQDADLAELETLWHAAKAAERSSNA